MQGTIEELQQEASAKGQQLKQRHLEQQRVLNDESLATLAADFAQVSARRLFRRATRRMGTWSRRDQETRGVAELAYPTK
jgi:hypothetical protein